MDQGNGSFSEIRSNRLLVHEDGLVVVPLWKADVTRISGEIDILRKRIAALDGIKNDQTEDGPVSAEQYEQVRGQYEARIAKMQESGEKLAQEISGRMEELDRQDEALARFLVNVNIQFRSGEVTEESFHSTANQCAAMRTRNAKEREELVAVYGVLAPQAKGQEERRPQMQAVAAH